MARPPEATEDDAFSDADRQWFDRLRGEAVVGGDPDALREADLLREAFEHEGRAIDADPELESMLSPDARARRREALHARLDREGHGVESKRRRWWGAGLALAASLVLAVFLVPRFGDDGGSYDEPPVTRGAVSLVVRKATNPRSAAEGLAAALRGAGLKAQVYRHEARYFVDTAVPADADDAALAAIRDATLPTTPGALRIEFTRQ